MCAGDIPGRGRAGPGRWLSKAPSAGLSDPPTVSYTGPWISFPFVLKLRGNGLASEDNVCLSLPGVRCSSRDAAFPVRSGESSYTALMGKVCLGKTYTPLLPGQLLL